MANKKLFNTAPRATLPPTNTFNEAGGSAYEFSDEHALAQYAVTGCLNGTYYATADTQLQKTLELAQKVTPRFLAQVAIYAREKGFMKDMPALLLAILSTRDIELTKRAFPRVCDDTKMVKNFVQIIRSGQVGRKSLGTALKRLIQDWLASRTEEQLFKGVVGNDPSLADIIKMVHPKPKNRARSAFYKYVIGAELTAAQTKLLPENILAFEKFKKKALAGKLKGTEAVPDVPFMMLTNLGLSTQQYRQLAENMSWSALRQNLNALGKHNVFEDEKFSKTIAAKLGDAGQVRRAKAMPFQLFSAWQATSLPATLANALQKAMDHSLSNVPEVNGKVYVAVDISGSMHSSATGNRGSATSSVTCLDAAAVMGSAMLRRNPDLVEIIPFSSDVTPAKFNSMDAVTTNVERLKALRRRGGTNCSSVLKHLNAKGVKGVEAVIYLSDNESWMDSRRPLYYWGGGGATETMEQWNLFRKRNPNARLVCIDIQPNSSTQAQERPDILNVGGFSDNVFNVVDLFLKGDLTGGHWVGTIKNIDF